MSTLVVSYYPHSYECNFSNCAEKPEFFRLLYAIAKIGSITTRMIASLDFTSAVQYMISFILHIISSLIYSSWKH